MKGKDYILVALDVEAPEEALRLYDLLKDHVEGFKIGPILFTLDGPTLVKRIRTGFLDLKFHDIPNTVAGAVYSAAKLGVQMCNVHCLGGQAMMIAAKQSLDKFFRENGWRPLLIGVTILTSHDEASLAAVGIDPNTPIPERVAKLAVLAYNCGLDGVVCSPQEISVVRKAVCDDGFLVVTPGIRSSSDDKADQKRTLTAGEAVKLGASRIVVGRPIIAQVNPVEAADVMAAEIDSVLAAQA